MVKLFNQELTTYSRLFARKIANDLHDKTGSWRVLRNTTDGTRTRGDRVMLRGRILGVLYYLLISPDFPKYTD